MSNSESRYFKSLATILGHQPELAETEVEKIASDQDPMTKIASMSLEQIMDDPNFLKGLEDRFAARSAEIDEAISDYLLK